jgi:hypothetical protein
MKEIGHDSHDIEDKFAWASKNWVKNLKEAVDSH